MSFWNKKRKAIIISLILALGVSGSVLAEPGPGNPTRVITPITITERSFDVSQFEVPSGAKNLVVVEGFAPGGGRTVNQAGTVSDESLWNKVRVTAYTRSSASTDWAPVVQSAGVMGWAGMSNVRYPGSGMTPIGLFKMHTAFGRKPALAGFSGDYTQIMLEQKNQYWSDDTNTLAVENDILKQNGEKLWSDGFDTIYDYCIDSGFDIGSVNKDGTALFLHCTKEAKPSTAGCVAIDSSAMIAIERLFALGDTYIAQAPESQFDGVYHAYNATGKSPAGTFSNSDQAMPATETQIAGELQ